jgi:hypothetical protein
VGREQFHFCPIFSSGKIKMSVKMFDAFEQIDQKLAALDDKLATLRHDLMSINQRLERLERRMVVAVQI